MVKENFIIRFMTRTDVEDVFAIESMVNDFSWSRSILLDCLRVGYGCFVLEVSGSVEGFVIISIVNNECHFLNLCISSKYQSKGYGKKLIEFVIFIAQQKCKRLWLEVRQSNFIAINLYKNLGFEQISIRKNYYPNHDGREDALVFSQDLD